MIILIYFVIGCVQEKEFATIVRFVDKIDSWPYTSCQI